MRWRSGLRSAVLSGVLLTGLMGARAQSAGEQLVLSPNILAGWRQQSPTPDGQPAASAPRSQTWEPAGNAQPWRELVRVTVYPGRVVNPMDALAGLTGVRSKVDPTHNGYCLTEAKLMASEPTMVSNGYLAATGLAWCSEDTMHRGQLLAIKYINGRDNFFVISHVWLFAPTDKLPIPDDVQQLWAQLIGDAILCDRSTAEHRCPNRKSMLIVDASPSKGEIKAGDKLVGELTLYGATLTTIDRQGFRQRLLNAGIKARELDLLSSHDTYGASNDLPGCTGFTVTYRSEGKSLQDIRYDFAKDASLSAVLDAVRKRHPGLTFSQDGAGGSATNWNGESQGVHIALSQSNGAPPALVYTISK